MALADRIALLPVAIHVDAVVAFNVTHADLHLIGSKQGKLFAQEMICINKADAVTTSRCNLHRARKSTLLGLPFGRHSVRISATPLSELPITYVGHSPFRDVTVHDSCVYIDQGAGARTSTQAEANPPTVIDHQKFAYWRGGVVTVRGVAAPAPN
jgi:hypothetical protein